MKQHNAPDNDASDSNYADSDGKQKEIVTPLIGTSNQNDSADQEQETTHYPKRSILIRSLRTLVRPRRWRKKRDMAGLPTVNWVEKATLVVAILVFGVTAIQSFIYDQQTKLMRATLGQTERAVILNMGQLAVANRNAKVSENALIDSQKSSNLDQRAWLSVHGAGTFNPPDNRAEVGKPLDARIVFQNTGKTPARNIRIIQLKTIKITKGKVPEVVDVVDYSKFPITFIGTVMPSTGIGTAFSDTVITPRLEQSDFAALAENRLHIFTHGKITYCDVFGKEHWTTWCYHLLSGGGYAVCKNSNDIDAYENPPPCPVKP